MSKIVLSNQRSLSAIDELFSQIDHLNETSQKHSHYHSIILRNKESFTSLLSNDDFIRKYFEGDDVRCKITYSTVIRHILHKLKTWVLGIIGHQKAASAAFADISSYERDIFGKIYSDCEYEEEYDLDNKLL